MNKGLLTAVCIFVCICSRSQTYQPITVTGFNVDAFAEVAPSTLLTTSASLDLTNHVMYTQAFAAATGLSGGVVNNGSISYTNSGITKNFQLAPYNGSNVMSIPSATTNKLLNVSSPASYTKLSLLLFATEATCNVSILVRFTDGTFFNAGNFPIQDWFNGTNAVYAAFGRCIRTGTPPYNADGLPLNPMFYSLDISVPCGFQGRLLQSLSFTYTSGTTTNSTAYILALSGVAVATPAITPTIVNAKCIQSNGSISLNVAGGPYTYAWNSTPAQNSAVLSNVPAGNYTATISSVGGCPFSYTGKVGIDSPVTLTASATAVNICEGNSTTLNANTTGGTLNSYTWSPGNLAGNSVTVTPASTTTYRINGQDNFGCNDTAYVTVNVNPVPTSTFTLSASNACTGDTILLNYTGNGNASANYNWNFGPATVLSGSNAGPYKIKYATPGNNSVSLTVSIGSCSSSSTLPVNLNQRYTASFTLSADSICNNKNVTVTYTGNGIAAANYAWNFGNGTIQQGSGQGPYIISYTSNTNPYLSLSVTASGCTSDLFLDTIAVITKPSAAFGPATVSGCDSAVVSFNNTSQNAINYYWTFGDGNNAASTTPSHTYYTGTYSVRLVAQNHICYDTLDRTGLVQVKPTYTASFSMSKDSICAGNDIIVTYNGNAPATAGYNWAFGNGTVAQGTTQGPYTVSYASNANPYLSLSVSNGSCISPVYRDTLAVITRPVAAFNADTLSGCGTLDVSFSNNSQNMQSAAWTFGDGTISAVNTPSHHYITGTYSVRLIAANYSCYDTLTKTDIIKVYAVPVAGFSSSPLPGTTLPLSKADFSFTNSSSNAITWKWMFGDGDSSAVTNPAHLFNSAGTFSVLLYAYNAFGCSDTAMLHPYIIIPDLDIKIPNVFSPNGDGINDQWNIQGLIGQDEALVEVFDRWGHVVHRSSGNYVPWDGNLKGKPLPVGTYYYLLRVAPGEKVYSGWVYIVR
jgi:gliding motility-associated-like protein